jgi:hypothetical protein
MISQSLVELIQKNAETLAQHWLKDVRENAQTPYYHTLDPDVLHERAVNIYKGLGHWLSVETPKEETAKFFRKWGYERYREGVPLPELIYSYILFRRHLWLYVLHVGFLDNAYELHRALELDNRVILFFDRSLYNMVIGYEEGRKKTGV